MEAIGQSFAALASGMTSCNLLSEAATVSPADVPSLLQLGRGETMDYDRTDTLVSLIQRQVRLTPDATAIVYQNTRMTYRQVDELTDRLASYLLTHYHVKPGRGRHDRPFRTDAYLSAGHYESGGSLHAAGLPFP